MRNKRFALVAALAVALTLTVGIAGEGSYFDLKNCTICRNLDAEEGLMEHMEWEIHETAAGMLTVTAIDPEYREAFGRAAENMQQSASKLTDHSKVCGFCQNYGQLMMSGAKEESFETDLGYISLLTSTDPAVVKMIHEHAQRTVAEYEKWKAEQAQMARK